MGPLLQGPYIADSFMPCHCDARPLAAYSEGGIHKQWEKRWEKRIGTYFSKQKLKATGDTPLAILARTEAVDDELGIVFPNEIAPPRDGSIWKQAVVWARGSFALASILFPQEDFPYAGDELPRF